MTGKKNATRLVSFIVCFIAASCGHSDRYAKNGSSELLSSLPYTPVTDSIRKFPGDAGLYLRRAELLTQNNQHELAESDYSKSWDLAATAETGYRYVSNLSIQGK